MTRSLAPPAQIITPDDSEDAPAEYMGYNITTISGFRFPLYKQICLSAALAPRGGWRSWGRRLLMDTNAWNEASLAKRVLADTKPDLVHITSPGFVMLGLLKFVQEDLDVPLVFSYHTHLPLYGRNYMGWLPGVEEICWWALRSTHNRADLTRVTAPPIIVRLLPLRPARPCIVRQLFITSSSPFCSRTPVWNSGECTIS